MAFGMVIRYSGCRLLLSNQVTYTQNLLPHTSGSRDKTLMLNTKIRSFSCNVSTLMGMFEFYSISKLKEMNSAFCFSPPQTSSNILSLVFFSFAHFLVYIEMRFLSTSYVLV